MVFHKQLLEDSCKELQKYPKMSSFRTLRKIFWGFPEKKNSGKIQERTSKEFPEGTPGGNPAGNPGQVTNNVLD